MEELWLTTWDVEKPVQNEIFSHMILKPDDMTWLFFKVKVLSPGGLAWRVHRKFRAANGNVSEKGWGTSFQETNIQVAPENWELAYYFTFWNGIFSGAMKVFLGGFLEGNVGSATVIILTCVLFTLLQPFS